MAGYIPMAFRLDIPLRLSARVGFPLKQRFV